MRPFLHTSIGQRRTADRADLAVTLYYIGPPETLHDVIGKGSRHARARVTMSDCAELQSTTSKSKHRDRLKGVMVVLNVCGRLGW
jgi:hypothetical protein